MDEIPILHTLAWLQEVKAAAWDEGFDAGERDVLEHETFNEPCIKNPYRDHADPRSVR